jgi:Ricin-type beta-trefoil lectin domain-like
MKPRRLSTGLALLVAIATFGAFASPAQASMPTHVTSTRPSSASASAGLVEDTPIRLLNGDRIAGGATRCLLFNGSADGTVAELWNQCFSYPQPDQYWELSGGQGNPYMLKNHASGKCLVVDNTSNNTKARERPCNPNNDRYWWYIRGGEPGGGPMPQIVNKASGKCLSGMDTPDPAEAVYQYTCLSYFPLDQQWAGSG